MAKCKACGADVRFDPATQLLLCDACGSTDAVHDQALTAEEQTWDEVKEYMCPKCGGSIFTTDSTAATFCSFCGASVVLQSATAEYERPDSIIPFRVTKEEAKGAYLAKIKKALFAPSALRNDTKVEKVRGIYMPYKVANYRSNGYSSILSIHHRSSGDYDITETMRDTFHADVALDVSRDALGEFSDVISQGIQPFEMESQVEYSPAYLSGFYADKADMDDDGLLKLTQEEATTACQSQLIRKAIRGNTLKTVEHMPETRCDGISTVLCPVWFISNKQTDGSISYAAVNGQTGEVAAEVPIDKKRFFIISGIVSLVAYLILILTMSFTPHYALGVMGSLALVAAYVLYEASEELYVHNKELEGIAVPVKASSNANTPTGSLIFLACFLGFIPTIFVGALLQEMFGMAGLIAMFLGGFLLLKKWLRRYTWFQKIFGRDYEVPKGALTKYILKPLIAAGIAMFMFMVDPAADLIQYITAGVVFAMTLWSFLDIIKVHNQMASRKPAQLQRRGGDDNA